jgi:biotin-dependent carboxylase-like uncharacterized protein
MRPALRILAPGLLTTAQDLGRVGYQRLGIPVGGALDPVSLRAANALVRNAPGAGALEVAYMGPTFAIEADDVRLSFVGAAAAIDVLADAAATTGQRIDAMRSIRLRRGQVVRIGSLTDGAVLYIAVEGGFDIPPVLGSVSTYIRGGFGGWQGRALVAGDEIPLCRTSASNHEDRRLEGLDLTPPKRFRAIAGPQDDYFSEREIAAFFGSEYTIGGSDRMGMRLSGRQLDHARGYNIISDGIAPGSIQVPGNGQPIVLLADRQTTGGYPKIATVVSADLPALGRLRVGAKIGFEPVTHEAALDLRRKHLAEIDCIENRIVPIRRDEQDVTAMLLAHNLISGVVDANARARPDFLSPNQSEACPWRRTGAA